MTPVFAAALNALATTDALLRGVGPFHPRPQAPPRGWWLPAIILGFAPIYGAAMGSFQFDSAERVLQVLYSAVKAPLLLFAASLICLPGFFVLNTVLGLRDDFREACRAILAGQAGLSVVLAALAPLTRFWYFTSSHYRAALLFNAAMFLVATLAGHFVMLRYYRRLIERRRYHRVGLLTWLVMYAFVGIQMGWMLRPFVGAPDVPVTFFRAEPFSNAYVVLVRLVVPP